MLPMCPTSTPRTENVVLRSMTTVFAPLRAAASVALMPARPAPTTTTSKSCVSAMSAMGSGATSHVCFAPVVSPPFDELLASDASDDAAGLHAGSATAAAAAAPVTSAPFKKFLRLISIQIPLPSGPFAGPLPLRPRGGLRNGALR